MSSTSHLSFLNFVSNSYLLNHMVAQIHMKGRQKQKITKQKMKMDSSRQETLKFTKQYI